MAFQTTSSATVNVSGAVTVASTGAMPIPSSDQTAYLLYGQFNASEQTLATVTAGKKAHVIGMVCVEPTGAGYVSVKKPDGTTVCYFATESGKTLICEHLIWTYAAGEAMKFQGTNTTYYNILYIEVDA